MTSEDQVRLAQLRGWRANELGLAPSASVEELLDSELYERRMRYKDLGLRTWADVFLKELLAGREPELPAYAEDALARELAQARLEFGRMSSTGQAG